MLNHVLIPLDGSPLAEEALNYAKQIARPGGKITLVTAVDLSGLLAYDVYPIMGVRVENPEGAAVYGADKLVAQARTYSHAMAERLSDYVVEIIVEIGEPAALITRVAQEHGVEVIVMSTHGRSGLSRWLLGSVTHRVLGASPCPVFVIPNKQRHQQPDLQTEGVAAQ